MKLQSAAVVLSTLAFFAATSSAQQDATTPSDCPCGFRDPSTERVYTESLIIYFNETTTLQNDSIRILDYRHKKEKGWRTTYRQGSTSNNLVIGNQDALPWQEAVDGDGTSLEAYLNPPDHHFVDGIHLQSHRQDILYGTFRASMRSPQPWVGGSAWTIGLNFNESNRLQMDMLNMNMPTDAKIEQLVNGEAPDNSLAVNYTVLQAGTEGVPPIPPWDFLDMRFDWAEDSVDFWIGTNRTRSVTKRDRTVPTVPQPLYLRHWCTGDPNYMQGPPVNRSVANVRFVRAFFNSSLMTEAGHAAFDERCSSNQACSIDNHSLRDSTAYSAAATVAWVEPQRYRHLRWVAGVVAGVFSVFGVAALVNAFFRRVPWRKLKDLKIIGSQERQNRKLRDTLRASISQPAEPPQIITDEKHKLDDYSLATSANPSANQSVTFLPEYTSRMQTPDALSPVPSYQTLGKPGDRSSWPLAKITRHNEAIKTSTQNGLLSPMARPTYSRKNTDEAYTEDTESSRADPRMSDRWSNSQMSEMTSEGDARTPNRWSRMSEMTASSFQTESDRGSRNEQELEKKIDQEPESIDKDMAIMPLETQSPEQLENKKSLTTIVKASVHPHPNTAPVASPKQRIDYLAGFVALSCIGVTLRHFSLTFWPYVTESAGTNKHFDADTWLAYVLGPYLLTPLWIGPFFVTSCRFLTARYLKNGKLEDVANKVLLRGARMLIPCYIFMMLEYFFLELGITGMLEWLPSISYSLWPYVTPQPNFGVFINELVELTYLIPNGAPEVVNHYCIGILWTIPVQHFYSYVTLLAAVMIRPVKTPWKRFGFYSIAIVCGWYATSWSACHWAGLMLADLDITYGWIKWAQAKWYRLYPLLTISALVAGATPLILLFNTAFYDYPFMSYESGIHPEGISGRPILGTLPSVYDAYPDYYVPNLAILTFAVSLQIVVELSTWTQWVLSLKCFTLLHPHIMTIYLSHGLIFWSLGSWLAVTFATAGLPYSVVLLLTALICYTVILTLAFFLSPLIEFTTQSAMKHLWRWATEEPVPHRQTTAPFSKALIIDRTREEPEPELNKTSA